MDETVELSLPLPNSINETLRKHPHTVTDADLDALIAHARLVRAQATVRKQTREETKRSVAALLDDDTINSVSSVLDDLLKGSST